MAAAANLPANGLVGEAAYWFHPPTGEMVLAWSLEGDGLALVGYRRDFSEAEFMELAESVSLEADASAAPSGP